MRPRLVPAETIGRLHQRLDVGMLSDETERVVAGKRRVHYAFPSTSSAQEFAKRFGAAQCPAHGKHDQGAHVLLDAFCANTRVAAPRD